MMLGLVALAASVFAPKPASGLTFLRGAQPVALRSGTTIVPNFAGDGRSAMISQGWRDNGNARGYRLWVVMMHSRGGVPGWNVVGLERGTAFDDTIRDDPHTGEDVASAVRFVRVRYRGHSQVLLVIATRHWRESIPDPAPTTISVYRVRPSSEPDADGFIGRTAAYFAPVGAVKTRALYCHADMALKREAGLPLPRDYSGAPTATGC